jgi:hypothetical protein
MLPTYDYGEDPSGISYNEPTMQAQSCTRNTHQLLVEEGFPDGQGLKKYTDEWLSEGKVPEELENLIVTGMSFNFK